MNKRFKVITAAVLSYVLLLCLLSPLGSMAKADQSADIAFDFEDGTAMGWTVGWGQFAEEHPIEIVEELADEGNRFALKANTAFASDGSWQAAALVWNSDKELGAYEQMTFDVFVPASFPGEFVVDTAVNNGWQGLKYSPHQIADAPKRTINGQVYAVLREQVAIPSSVTQKQLVIQLAVNSAVTYNGPVYVDNIALKARTDVEQPPGPGEPATVYWAKDAVAEGGQVEFRTAGVEGDEIYAGEGYMSFFYEGAMDEGTAAFRVNVPQAGLYNLTVGYYAPYGYKESALIVNGQGHGAVALPALPEGQVTGEAGAVKAMLQEGDNTVALTRGWGYYGIEYVKVEPNTPPPVFDKLEAEDGVMTGSVVFANEVPGYSGNGYALFHTGGTLSWTYHAASGGLYDVAIGFSAPYGDKKTELVVNGGSLGEVSFASTTEFTEVQAGKAMLQPGDNHIQINANWGWYLIDYITLTAASAGGEGHQVKPVLVNPNASWQAKALMHYMTGIYGNQILSGQQTLEDAEWLYEQTGRYPAILATDLMDYSPSRVERGTTSSEVEKMIDWFNRGGIISLCWHWNAPKDLYDEPGGKEWWRGFYTEATSFDLAYALANKDSEDYSLLIRDIDAIAVQLKRLQDAGVPVLWRPLHEAEGGWFWWGAKGPEPAKELYRIMYDRLTNHHGLNNLIWVWNSEAEDWYPGDDVVDIASIDYYGPKGDYHPVSGKYDNLVRLTNGKKLIALTENGSIPDPELLQAYGADWLLFTTWSGDFIRDGQQNSLEHIRKVFNDDYVITLDELPDDLYATARLEAEDGVLTGVEVGRQDNGYSGTGYVTGFDSPGDSLKWQFSLPESADYRMTIRYKTYGGDKTQQLLLNGSKLADYTFKDSAEWKEALIGQFGLAAGLNTIEIANSWGWTDIDYIELTGGDGAVTRVHLTFADGNSGPADRPVALTALANNSAEYRFMVREAGGAWTALHDFRKQLEYMWLPKEPGEYEFKVEARPVGSEAGATATSAVVSYEALPSYADKPLVNPVFGDNMILQRDEQAEIWGWLPPGGEAVVKIGGKTVKAKANGQGEWKAKLGRYKAGGPHEITVSGGGITEVLSNVMFGDVYLASGQSNMAWKLSQSANAEAEIARADYPNIRFMTVPDRMSPYPVSHVGPQAEWKAASPATAGDLSAVAYFFARKMTEETDVPIGLIVSSVGGTKAENWMSYEKLKSIPSAARAAENVRSGAALVESGNSPASHYNGMIAPIAPYKFKGVLWYQGESNWGEYRYNKLLPELMDDWRSAFDNSKLPFAVIQISAFGAVQTEGQPAQPDDNPGLPVVREAQLLTVQDDKYAALVVTTDIGNPDDIHPLNKQDVGARTAIAVLGKFYKGYKGEYSGPIYKSMSVKGDKVTLRFDHAGSGLMAGVKEGLEPVREDASAGGKLKGFAVAGKDGVFYAAEARVAGKTVIVSSPYVAKPVAVRYNWYDSPIGNLYNKDGLPASPFRTDLRAYLHVEGGSGSGLYKPGEEAAVAAYAPEAGYRFDKWIGDANIRGKGNANAVVSLSSLPYTEIAATYKRSSGR